nr:hypothetical protein [Tanacetum cinerariifolium]
MGHYSWDVIGGTSLWWDTRGGTTKVGHQRLSAYWKAFFVSLGGPYGSCGTALYLMLLLLPARRSLMI